MVHIYIYIYIYTVYICDLSVSFVCSNATQLSFVGMSNCQSLRNGIEIGSVHMLRKSCSSQIRQGGVGIWESLH